MRISIQKGYEGRERTAVVRYANERGIPITIEEEASEGCVPVGTVEYCLTLFGRHRVDFYPPFLLNRRVAYAGSRADLWFPQWIAKEGEVFVKRAGVWKDAEHPARVFEREKITTPLPFWYSEKINFLNEWRLYVLNGEILAAGWYSGTDEDATIPHLDRIGRIFPGNFSGAVDIGQTDKGDFELVEAQPPFACGWYGESSDYALYGRWIFEGWKNSDWWKS